MVTLEHLHQCLGSLRWPWVHTASSNIINEIDYEEIDTTNLCFTTVMKAVCMGYCAIFDSKLHNCIHIFLLCACWYVTAMCVEISRLNNVLLLRSQTLFIQLKILLLLSHLYLLFTFPCFLLNAAVPTSFIGFPVLPFQYCCGASNYIFLMCLQKMCTPLHL